MSQPNFPDVVTSSLFCLIVYKTVEQHPHKWKSTFVNLKIRERNRCQWLKLRASKWLKIKAISRNASCLSRNFLCFVTCFIFCVQKMYTCSASRCDKGVSKNVYNISSRNNFATFLWNLNLREMLGLRLEWFRFAAKGIFIWLCCIVLHCIALYCIALRCVALHCIAFYSILFYSIVCIYVYIIFYGTTYNIHIHFNSYNYI